MARLATKEGAKHQRPRQGMKINFLFLLLFARFSSSFIYVKRLVFLSMIIDDLLFSL
jgi:hypothetical protein